MGPFCSVIYNEKQKTHGNSRYMQYGTCTMKNNRTVNDDGVVARNIWVLKKVFSFFGVFDGMARNNVFNHVSVEMSQFCKENIIHCLLKKEFERYKKYEGKKDSGKNDVFLSSGGGDRFIFGERFEEFDFLSDNQVIIDGFLELDNLLKKTEFGGAEDQSNHAGCESTCVILNPAGEGKVEIICANLGRCLGLFYNPKENENESDKSLKNLAQFHTPLLESERLRIERAGGGINQFVVYDGLHFTRCFGFFQGKNKEIREFGLRTEEKQARQPIIAAPSIHREVFDIFENDDYSFLLLSTEGLFENQLGEHKQRIYDEQFASKVCSIITERLREQELGVYYENETRRTREILENYDPGENMSMSVENPEYSPLPQKSGGEGFDFVYDLDAIVGEICDYTTFIGDGFIAHDAERGSKRKSRGNTTLILVLMRGKKGKISRGYMVHRRDERERVEFLLSAFHELRADLLKVRVKQEEEDYYESSFPKSFLVLG